MRPHRARFHQLGQLPPGVVHRRAMDRLALEQRHLSRQELWNEHRRFGVRQRPNLRHRRLAEVAETCGHGVVQSAANGRGG